jgi:uncharacterized cupin superfamily protein
MGSVTTDRLDGVNTAVAIKAPVRVATTANITLSATQTIDGVAVVANDRVLVKDQTDTTENGIYDVNAGAWTRAKDFDGNRDVVTGTVVYTQLGTDNADIWFRQTTTGTIVIGTSVIAWTALAFTVSALSSTSTSSLTVGTGSKTFTVSSGRAWVAGQRLRAADSTSAYIMDGEITSYSGTTLILDIDYTEGSGTNASWNIGLIGARGATGATGSTGSQGPAGTGSMTSISFSNGIKSSTGGAISSSGDIQLDVSNLTSAGANPSSFFFAAYASSTGTHVKVLSSAVALMGATNQLFSGGGYITSRNISTGSFTVNYGAGPLQYVTGSTAAWTITAATGDGSCVLLVTNPVILWVFDGYKHRQFCIYRYGR